jgi:hypothetical protein
MAATPQPGPSFSAGQRWRIALNVLLSTLAVSALVVMANYLSRDWFLRIRCGSHAGAELSPMTIKCVRAITNNVNVTLYYDRDEPLFSAIAALLKEYNEANSHLVIQAVDYERNPAAGLRIQESYHLAKGQKDVVIFDCAGKVLILPGKELTKAVFEKIPNDKEGGFRRKLTDFEGERAFTSVLIAITNPTKPKAYFLQSHHGEPVLENGGDAGYLEFETVLGQNNVQVEPLDLQGTNAVPGDCRLLIVAGAQTPLDSELDKIDQYLTQGGRLLALFDSQAVNRTTGVIPANGLEAILAKWGVEVGDRVIRDLQNSTEGGRGWDVKVFDFDPNHPVVNPLVQRALHLMMPRSISRLKARLQAPDALKVEEIAFSGASAFAVGDDARKRKFPLIATVDATIKGVTTERGSTRILVAGDSLFLDNKFIKSADNRAFVGYAVNWLLDRLQLIEVGPQPVREYRVLMTKAQMQNTQLLLMAAMPGGLVFLGCLVWLRRRR